MAPPPAINLANSDQPSFIAVTSSKINNNVNSSSRSSEEADGAVDELHVDISDAVIPSSSSNKRPRGRPPGSKNKPKIPTYLSVDPQDALRSHVMEVSSGADISSSLAAYARTRGRGIAVLHASGSVADVSFRHDVNLKGKLDIISLSGTVLPDNTSMGPTGLTLFVSGPHGQVMGGPVEGRLVAAGTVMVMAATFSTATYEKLPLQAEAAGPSGPVGPGLEDPRSGGFHPGYNMGPPENGSYAWYLQQQQQHHQNNNDSNNRPLYMNN